MHAVKDLSVATRWDDQLNCRSELESDSGARLLPRLVTTCIWQLSVNTPSCRLVHCLGLRRLFVQFERDSTNAEIREGGHGSYHGALPELVKAILYSSITVVGYSISECMTMNVPAIFGGPSALVSWHGGDGEIAIEWDHLPALSDLQVSVKLELTAKHCSDCRISTPTCHSTTYPSPLEVHDAADHLIQLCVRGSLSPR